jgi:sugar lactone lactonase YvrE
LSQRGDLGRAEIVLSFGTGIFPDGFEFDDSGGIWITSLISNRLLRFADGRLETMVEDVNEGYVAEVERAFAAGAMAAQHLGPIPGTTLQHVTSLTFAGADRRTVCLGTLHGTCLYRGRLL